jgi:PAP2 superfamily
VNDIKVVTKTMRALLIAVLLSNCASTKPDIKTSASSSDATPTIFFWSDQTLVLIKKYQLNPLRAVRVLAYTHRAMDEAAKLVEQNTLKAGCNDVAIDKAASQMLEYFFPQETEGRMQALAQLKTPNNSPCEHALSSAQKIVEANISTALRDGALPPRRLPSTPQIRNGVWRATSPLFITSPVEPFAGGWKTFFNYDIATLAIPMPILTDSEEYKLALNEVLVVKRNLTQTQIDTAQFWHLEAGSVTPPGIWNLKLRELLIDTTLSQQEVSRLFAVMNMAMYDSFVACWRAKYTYWTERPISAAERLSKETFTPLLITPPFPGYPSGHACASGAASTVVGKYLPQTQVLVYGWAEEAAHSRLLGGIHFHYDNEAGLLLGRKVGEKVIAEMPPH